MAFDEHAGFGTVAAEAGGPGDGGEWFFHCTQLTDGTRAIEVGAAVRFEVVAGHRGQWEAVRVERA